MRKILGLFAFMLFLSCDAKQESIDNLKEETIEIHDEVMPKMDDIMRLKRALKVKRDSVSAKEQQKIDMLIVSLEEADESMMNWMRNYDPQMKEMDEEQKIAYLKDQKASISVVSKKMNESISKAEEFLN